MDYTIYIQISEDEELVLEKSAIEQCSDESQLKEWHDLVTDAVDDLRVVVKVNQEVGEDSAGLNFKYGRYKLAEHWLTKRLKKLVTNDDEKDARIKQLIQHIAALEDAIGRRNETIARLKDELVATKEPA